MARTVTATVKARTELNSTQPIYVVQLAHSGDIENLSVAGDITYDGTDYAAGGVVIEKIQAESRATLRLFATMDRINESVGGTWRNKKVCRIYAIPGDPDAEPIYAADEGVLVLDGYIDVSSYRGDWVTIEATQKTLRETYTPRLNCSELSIHVPPVGTSFTWEGETYVLKAADT
jgi:hypothetical protein